MHQADEDSYPTVCWADSTQNIPDSQESSLCTSVVSMLLSKQHLLLPLMHLPRKMITSLSLVVG